MLMSHRDFINNEELFFLKRTPVASCGDKMHIEVSWVFKNTLHETKESLQFQRELLQLQFSSLN